MFGKTAKDVESKIAGLYGRFEATAKRYRHSFRRPSLTIGGIPTVLFLGNHSSGKSTIVNDLLGEPPVQDTGVAPTDDGFTVLVHGTDERDVKGPSALGLLPVEFGVLSKLGPEFLAHLVVKVRDRDFLRKARLVDSPGMIDTPSGSARRTYDFTAAVRALSELSDLVLFLFDPEKPGTTGETMDVLSDCLQGLSFKLRVLLNKSDTFDSMEDFARTYGTLCWNLARTLPSKDLPPIYATFTPSTGNRMAAKIPLDTFERHRAAFLREIQSAKQLRIDALLAGVSDDFSRLLLQVRVSTALARSALAFRLRSFVEALVFVALAGFGCWRLFAWGAGPDASWLRKGSVGFGAMLLFLALTLAAAVATHYRFRQRLARMVADLDTTFRTLFAHSFAMEPRGDLEQHWKEVRPGLERHLVARSYGPLFSWGDCRRIQRALDEEIPSFARTPYKTPE